MKRIIEKTIELNEYRIFYREVESDGPILLMLHGIPVDSTLWEGVISNIHGKYRIIAPDLIGFGQSEKAVNFHYSLDMYTDIIRNFIRQLNLKDIILVGMDLGLMIGLNYFRENKDNVRAIVMMEGFILDIDTIIGNQSFLNRFLMKQFKREKIAKKVFVDRGLKTIKRMLINGTYGKVEHLELYMEGFKDYEIRKKILFDGVSSYHIAQGIKGGPLAILVHQYVEMLNSLEIPKLLLYGKPGVCITHKSVQHLEKTMASLTSVCVGKGLHFLPFDQPKAIGSAIESFLNDKI